eukprot:1076938-Rhodomonas_salina.1
MDTCRGRQGGRQRQRGREAERQRGREAERKREREAERERERKREEEGREGGRKGGREGRERDLEVASLMADLSPWLLSRFSRAITLNSLICPRPRPTSTGRQHQTQMPGAEVPSCWHTTAS